MRIRLAVAVFLVLAGIGAVFVASQGASNGAAAAGPFRIIVPNLAGDSAPPSAQPTPTPTPTPIGGGPNAPERWARVDMTITARELAATASGLSPIQIYASASVRLPTALDGPITVTGTVTLSPHEVDSAGCTWTRTLTNPNFTMTLYYSGDLSVLAGVDGPEWYYMVQCPGDPRPPPPVRFPAFGVEGIRYFLQYALAPYRTTEGLRLPTQVYTGYPSGVGCLKRWAVLNQTAFNADVEVDVWVYEPGYPGGCLLPLLP